jgi:alanyl-tRNA synthetase
MRLGVAALKRCATQNPAGGEFQDSAQSIRNDKISSVSGESCRDGIGMTERLYYHDPFLYEFEGEVVELVPASEINARHGVVLDRTAFYPTSGGQVHDTGWFADAAGAKTRVAQVEELEDGRVVHYLEAEVGPEKGSRVRGVIDDARRRDHMQQHSGQHVLSAAFIRLFEMPTVSFHMGDETCSIDLDTAGLSAKQVVDAERLANQIVQENRPVAIKFVRQEDVASLGLRKVPVVDKAELRLIDIQDFDLTACGGTHVRGTGQIGCILLRKVEKVRQGWRVEFVCGQRAVGIARKDYSALTEAGGLFSAHIWEVPSQVRKTLEDVKAARKSGEHLLEELSEFQSAKILAETAAVAERKIIAKVWADRDAAGIKLLAQKLTRLEPNVVALLGTTSGQPALVFAQSPGAGVDAGSLLKETLAKFGGRGGGSKDFAQGGLAKAEMVQAAVQDAAAQVQARVRA